MEFRNCTRSQLEEIRIIYNDIIATSTALYEYEPRSPERMDKWWSEKEALGIPVIGLFEGDEFLGFATWGPFRSAPAYSHTVEHSVYLKASSRGRGLGRLLLDEVCRVAKSKGAHLMVGVIDTRNQSSCRLHEAAGFALAGTLTQSGYKFDQWLDTVFYQKLL